MADGWLGKWGERGASPRSERSDQEAAEPWAAAAKGRCCRCFTPCAFVKAALTVRAGLRYRGQVRGSSRPPKH